MSSKLRTCGAFLIAALSASVARAEHTLYKDRILITPDIQSFHIQEDERIVLLGVKQRRFFTETWYWGESGYGALFGRRSGYIEGGVVFGRQAPLSERWFWDARLFAGAGGGGSAPQGGGFVVQGTGGLGYQFLRAWSAFAEAGYVRFLNGRIASWSAGFGLNLTSWSVTVED